MTDAFGIQLVAGQRIEYARERWQGNLMRPGVVVTVRRGLALVRLDYRDGLGGGTGWAGSSQLAAVPGPEVFE